MEPSTFEREMKKFDRHLRLRRSEAGSGYFIERKARRETACIPTPNDRGSIDRWIRDTQGYVLVSRLARHEINEDTLWKLRLSDMWQYRHPMTRSHASLAEKEEEAERERVAQQEKADSSHLQDVGCEVYDKHMSRQGHVVYPGLSTHQVAGEKA